MGGMNDNDPFADSLRSRLPLPRVSDGLLARLERRADWSEKPRLRPIVIIGLGLVLLAILYMYSSPSSPTAQTASPTEASDSVPIVAPANIPIAFAPSSDEELLESLSAVSKSRLNAEPAFLFDPDSVATRGESWRQLL